MILPLTFEERMQEQLGPEYSDFRASLEEVSPVSIRRHPLKSRGNHASSVSVPWCSLGEYLSERPIFTLDPNFHAGAYYVQEASSMMLELFYKAIPRTRKNSLVLDLCAAPGGKSTHLSALLEPGDMLVANEIHPTRFGILAENMMRQGYDHCALTNTSPATLCQTWPEQFDVILVDAPCSGEGMFRKDPGAIKEWSLNNVQICVDRQKEILHQAMGLLAPGGYLIYATCTYNEEENEQQMEWITATYHARHVDVPLKENWGIQKSRLGFRCYPHKVKGEGLYMCMLQKEAKTSTEGASSFSNSIRSFQEISAHHPLLAEYIQQVEAFRVFLYPDQRIKMIPETLYENFSHILRHPLCKRSGMVVGTLLSESVFQPDHALALSMSISDDVPRYSLSEEEALVYLRKQTLALDREGKGYHLASYNGFGLGWIKLIPGRINNLLPPGWRIRM